MAAGDPVRPESGPGLVKVVERGPRLFAAEFAAMASPCEVLVETERPQLAADLGEVAAAECLRIEHKYSRYRDDSVVAAIHASAGRRFEVDEETASLLDFAAECHLLSGGLFDITSGVLRKAWRFDGSDRVPSPAAVEALLPFVGFERLSWQRPTLTLPVGMELDLGGIGKEYAVDRAYDLVLRRFRGPFLVNFGGDLRASAPPAAGAWRVGIERPDTDRDAAKLLELDHGALATSGDSRRFLLRDGIRYGHILDPRTGWPVAGAPRSVTVAASSCTEAGLLSTLALLQGPGARAYLDEQAARYWMID